MLTVANDNPPDTPTGVGLLVSLESVEPLGVVMHPDRLTTRNTPRREGEVRLFAEVGMGAMFGETRGWSRNRPPTQRLGATPEGHPPGFAPAKPPGLTRLPKGAVQGSF